MEPHQRPYSQIAGSDPKARRLKAIINLTCQSDLAHQLATCALRGTECSR
jgi:hypothetical protein